MERAQTVPAMRKKNGEVQTAKGTGLALMCTTPLMRRKVIDPKAAAAKGAIAKPAKMAPSPLPLFHPHCCRE